MASYEVHGKVALVTGAGSGIGHALTEILLAAGCCVIMADLKLRPEATATIGRYHHPTVSPGGASAVFVEVDLADWGRLQAMWSEALTVFGRIDMVASVAGIYEPPWSNFWKPPGISTQSHDAADAKVGQFATIAVNLAAPIRLAQLAIDHWTQRRCAGNFLAVASISAYLHSIETPLYMASKAGLVSFIKSLGPLHGLCGIRVAAVCPGSVLTPIFEPEWNRKLTVDDVTLTPAECAAVCLRVMQEPQWGSGAIVETQKVGVKGDTSITVRDVKLEALYPLPGGRPNHHVIESRKKLVTSIQEKGMRS